MEVSAQCPARSESQVATLQLPRWRPRPSRKGGGLGGWSFKGRSRGPAEEPGRGCRGQKGNPGPSSTVLGCVGPDVNRRFFP